MLGINDGLIYDWNKNHPPGLKPPGPVLINDETLRDGLQSPSVRDPSIAEKIEILHLMEALGIHSLALGLPAAGPRAVEAVTALAREIAGHKMKIRANCAARTHKNDIRPVAEIVQKTGLPIEAATFIGSSPIRRFTEGWERRLSSADHRKGIYRMHIVEASASRLVFDVENVSTMRYYLILILHPDELQSMYFLDRESDNVWRYYSIVRTGKNANGLIAGNDSSSVNRAVAFYRYLVGVPTTQEPPGAR